MSCLIPPEAGFQKRGEQKELQSILIIKRKQSNTVVIWLEKEQSELYIHGKDGAIQRKDSYGNDPFPPKG
jgi:hypothetical protein